MEFTRLQRSEHFRASCLCRMYGRPGRKDIRPATCLSCQLLELNWNWHYEDIFFCSRCRDLGKQESHRSAVLKLLYHLTNTLPPSFLLPCLFDYLYPEAMRHKHTRTQQRRTLKFFLLGFPGTENSLFNLHVLLQVQQSNGHLRKGKTNYQQNRHYLNDLLTNVCTYLI